MPEEFLRAFSLAVDGPDLRFLRDVRPINPVASFEWAHCSILSDCRNNSREDGSQVITLNPSFLEKVCLPFILASTLAHWGLQPSIEVTRMDLEHVAHGSHRKLQPMKGNERVSHLVSLAKYAAAFLECHAPR